jgi:acyl-CoA synthetase (AMP-forming)/AMP-acid ligase II
MSSPLKHLLFDRFAEIALEHSNKTALIFNDEHINYAALLERVCAQADALQATWGLASGARITYVGLNNPEQIVTLLACAKVGVIFLPINYRLPEAEITKIENDVANGRQTPLSNLPRPPRLHIGHYGGAQRCSALARGVARQRPRIMGCAPDDGG